MPRSTNRKNIELPLDLHQQLAATARRNHMTTATAATLAVEYWLQQQEAPMQYLRQPVMSFSDAIAHVAKACGPIGIHPSDLPDYIGPIVDQMLGMQRPWPEGFTAQTYYWTLVESGPLLGLPVWLLEYALGGAAWQANQEIPGAGFGAREAAHYRRSHQLRQSAK